MSTEDGQEYDPSRCSAVAALERAETWRLITTRADVLAPVDGMGDRIFANFSICKKSEIQKSENQFFLRLKLSKRRSEFSLFITY